MDKQKIKKNSNKCFMSMTEKERKNFLTGPVMYEVRMLYFSCIKYYSLLESNIKDDKNLKNLFLECFILHAKVLAEFFHDTGKTINSDQIRAYHYFKSKEDYHKIINKENKELKSLRKDFNTYLSHLGALRGFNKKKWNIPKILHNNIIDSFEIFKDNLSKKYYDESLENY